jgi:hypothetical protein
VYNFLYIIKGFVERTIRGSLQATENGLFDDKNIKEEKINV